MFLVKLESGIIGYTESVQFSVNYGGVVCLEDAIKRQLLTIHLYNETGEIEYTETGKLLEVLK